MKSKLLVYACDSTFYEYCKASFASFCEYHSLSEWRVIFADVGLHSSQKRELACFGEVIEYEPYRLKQFDGVVFSAARARIEMLTDFIDDDNVLLYVDSDTLIFDSLDRLVSDFASSGKAIGIYLEEIHEFWRSPVSSAWLNGAIPAEFKNQDKWRNAPMANAGVLLAQGPGAREIGRVGISVYERYSDKLWLPEQAVIDTLLYDKDIPFMKLAPRYNCMAWERHITHAGKGPRYVKTRPSFRGETLAIRHFAGHDENMKVAKLLLDEVVPLLHVDARLSALANRSSRGLIGVSPQILKASKLKPSVAIAISVFEEPVCKLEACFKSIAHNFPDAIVAAFLDVVDQPQIVHLTREMGFLPMMGDNCVANTSCNTWWLRILYFFDFSKADICLTVAAKSMPANITSCFPMAHYFGDVAPGTSYAKMGIIGISREAVALLLDGQLFEVVSNEPTPLSALTDIAVAKDQALGSILNQMGLHPVQWGECKIVRKGHIHRNP
jgi:lipopolysaccharide biosynthesis glycosyltransferase